MEWPLRKNGRENWQEKCRRVPGSAEDTHEVWDEGFNLRPVSKVLCSLFVCLFFPDTLNYLTMSFEQEP